MTIVFICGSLEPGKDGVGDYTRRLAGELIKLGHDATILALNDRSLAEEIDGFQQELGKMIPTVRLPSCWSDKKRYATVKLHIHVKNPDWISLQFVPFSFHHKGLPLNLVRHLKPIFEMRNVHIMCHELWVGMEENSSWKYKLWGFGQKLLIQKLLEKLKPKVIQTQSTFFQKQLYQLGFSAQLLPLFGNIPRIAARKPCLNAQINHYKKKYTGVIFGSIRKNSPIDQFTEEASFISKNKGIDFELIIIGRAGNEQENWISTWEKAGLKVQVLGEQLPEVISEVFENSTFGISTTPITLVEKSGAVAAMREHGLPIICLSKPWHHLGQLKTSPPRGITIYQKGQLSPFLAQKKDHLFTDNATDISLEFINSLTS